MDTDGLVRLLGPHRRRALLRHLWDHRDGVADLDDLAEGVRQRCRADRVPETRMETRIQLHHTDLPKLEDAGVLEYDRSDGSVVFEGREGVEAILESLATGAD